MRVCYFGFYPPTLWAPGGGEARIRKTRDILTRRGLDVDLFDVWNPGIDYDLFHIFGSHYQLSDFVVTVKSRGVPVVVSTIFSTNKRDWQWKALKLSHGFIPVRTDYTYRQRIYDGADRLIAASRAEKEQLVEFFGVPRSKISVVHNFVNEEIAEMGPELFIDTYGLRDFVLEAGRISEFKGQLRLIEALRGCGLDLVLIGDIMPDEERTRREFLALLAENKWVHYLGGMKHDSEMLASAYSAAKVHVLPSHSESTGNVNLEAAACGANVVTLRNEAIFEYLGDHAIYCDPLSPRSIRESVLEAMARPRQSELQRKVLTEFSTDRIAKELIGIYAGLAGD